VPLPTRSAVLHTASTQVGVKERGKNIVRYWADLKPAWQGSPYCAAFVQWCLKQHGAWFDAPLPYYVPSLEAHARKHGLWLGKTATPRPGDLVVYGTTRGVHVGFVVGTKSLGRIETIEGNTSSGIVGSQSNGDGVYRRVRTRSWVRGFIRLPYAAEPAGAPAKPAPKPVAKPKPKPVASKPRLVADLRPGSRGSQVKVLQAVLNRYFPAYSRLKVDGSYGPATTSVVRELQRRAGLTVDGKAGPQVRRYLKRIGAIA
jgi:hypothetical protein